MALVTPTWKLSYFPEQGEGRLWDRKADPDEQNDLFGATDETTAAARTGLLLALLRWRAQQDAIAYLQSNSRTGAQTATLAFAHTNGIRGIDAELLFQFL